MRHLFHHVLIPFAFLCVLIAGSPHPLLADPAYLSPESLAVTPDGILCIAQRTANQVALWDPQQAKLLQTIALPFPPSGVAVSSDGHTLYVTGQAKRGQVARVDLRTNQIQSRIDVGHFPCAPVLSQDEKILYVCNQYSHSISVLALTQENHSTQIPVAREPIAAALTPDGKTLVVANHLHDMAANQEYVAAKVSLIDTTTLERKDIVLPNGSIGLKGVCISPDNQYAYVTHILARYQLPTTQLERGWMNTNAISIIHLPSASLYNTVLLDHVDLGAANPWGIACGKDGTILAIAQAGSNDISIIDRTALHAKLAKVEEGETVSQAVATPEDVPNDLSFLSGCRTRIPCQGKGPRGILIVDSTVYFTEYFSDSLGFIDLNSLPYQTQTMPLGPSYPLTSVRQGEMFFHDASLCFQQWQSCASCHPANAGSDGLNWDLLNDGVGNPKNSKSLLLSHQTPPAMSTGVRDRAEVAVRSGIRYIQFAVRPEEDAQAIDAYLQALQPDPSPYLIDGELSPTAQHGQKVFIKAKCQACHTPPFYTDMMQYPVGTGKNREAQAAFDTPTLIELWKTPPYLHDGRAVTLEEVLTTCNPEDHHGVTSTLTKEEIQQLVEFLLSL